MLVNHSGADHRGDRPEPAGTNRRLNRFLSLARLRVSHSHTNTTLQPDSRSASWLRASRARLAANFLRQKGLFRLGPAARAQPSCWCQ
jgi:hypothetical protein